MEMVMMDHFSGERKAVYSKTGNLMYHNQIKLRNQNHHELFLLSKIIYKFNICK